MAGLSGLPAGGTAAGQVVRWAIQLGGQARDAKRLCRQCVLRCTAAASKVTQTAAGTLHVMPQASQYTLSPTTAQDSTRCSTQGCGSFTPISIRPHTEPQKNSSRLSPLLHSRLNSLTSISIWGTKASR